MIIISGMAEIPLPNPRNQAITIQWL